MTLQEVNNFQKHLESSEYTEAISLAKSIIEPFISKDEKEYTESDISFINTSIPLIFKKLFLIGSKQRKIAQSMISFVENYLLLIVKMNLNEKLLFELCDCLQKFEKRITNISLIQLSDDEKAMIIGDLAKPKACINEPKDTMPAPFLISSTISFCFSTKLFKITIDRLRSENDDEKNKITSAKLSLMFRLFYIIEGYLTDEVILTLLPIFADAILNTLTSLVDDTGEMAQKLTFFIDIIPEKSDQILKLLCKLVSSGPVGKRLTTVKGIRSIVERKNVSKKNLEEVKATILNDEFDISNSQIFDQVLNFLPILSKEVNFTDDDLIDILGKVHSSDNHIYKCISEIIPNVKTNLKKFAQNFIDSDIYSPAIICSLISRITSKSINQLLFSRLLKPPQTYDNDPYSENNRSLLISTIKSSFGQSPNMKNLLETKMEETEDPEEICALSQILLNAPELSDLDQFFDKVINLSEEHECLIPILMSFSTLLDSFDSKDTITSLFNKAYHHFANSKNFKYLNQILPVLTEWFREAPYIDADLIIAKLMNISFMKITTKFVPFVSTVIERSSKLNRDRLKEFLLKIIYDTVPMKFSSWAIKNIFEYFHEDKATITCIVKMLTYHLQGDTIPVELFENVIPDNSSNTKNSKSNNTKRMRITTRSRSSRSRNQKRKKRFSDYSSEDDEDSSNATNSQSENDNFNDEENRFDEENQNSISLKDIILSQSESTAESLRAEKRNNAIHLVKRAAQYEADFYRIGDQDPYGTIFTVSVSNSKEKNGVEFEIGLHPFHTCRRLYLEVAKRLSIDKFNLVIPKKSPKEDKLLIFSTPISEIVEVNINKIKLKFVESPINTSLTELRIDPIFLTLWDEMESTRALHDLLLSEDSESKNSFNTFGNDEYSQIYSPIILETLQLFEPFIGYDAISPLQKVLHRNYDHPLDFENNKYLFPAALSAYSQPTMSSSDFSRVIELAINLSFDNFSAVIIMKAIMRIECRDFIFKPELIEKGLIQNKHKSLRHALLCHFNISSSSNSSLISPSMVNSYDEIVSLIPHVIEPIYRENSKEFLACFKKCNLSKDVFVPYYKKLNQYETSNNVDQTFISLLQLIPKNEETIKLTYERISVTPTVRNPQNPFVHCEKSRKAAFEFLTTDQVYPILVNHLSLLPEVPTFTHKLNDDFTFKGRNGINNLGSTCYINTLMQSLNSASNVANRILSLPTEKLTPYLSQLRDFMGQLRYSRNTSISIKSLIDTIPDFDPFKQDDTEEFLLKLINRVIDELKEDSKPLKEELELILETETYQIGSDKKEGDSNIDSSFVLPLQTQNSTNLLDSFRQNFKDDTVDDALIQSTQKKGTVIRKQRVIKWPNYLIIQLLRWEFDAEDTTGKKLVDEFGFPMEFSTSELGSISADKIKDNPIDYELSAILVHEGDIDSGHYFAIVKGENSDWYSCDDTEIKKFDISRIPELSFGSETNDLTKDNTNKILTAYLLFYRRVDIEVFEPHLEPDFEERINRFNETTWPSTFFFSKQFLNFTKNLTAQYPNNDATTEVALTCLFKIAVVSEPSARQWQEHIQQNFITNEKQCKLFFTFIREKIGKTLGQIVNLSDWSCDCLKSVIFTAFKQLQDTTEPLIVVLSCLDFAIHKRSITLACELISLACQDLHVLWKNEEEALLIMVKYITMEMGTNNILFSKIGTSLAESTEVLIKILSNVVLQKGVIEPIAIIFQNDVLYRLLPILKQSESFKVLTKSALSLQPSLISSIGDTSTKVTELLMNALHKIFVDSLNSPSISSNSSSEKVGQPLPISSNSVGGILEKLCFSSRRVVRERICKTLCKVMDEPDPVVAKYINNRVFESDLICPSIVDESTFLDMLASLLPIGLSKYDLVYFNEFSKVLIKLCIAAPFATSLSFSEIIKAIPEIASKVDYDKNRGNNDDKLDFDDEFDNIENGGFDTDFENVQQNESSDENDEDDVDDDQGGGDNDLDDLDDNDNQTIGVDLLIRLMVVVKHLVAFNDDLRDQIPPSVIETFMNLESGREEALQFVALFQKEASGSTLFASCVSEALRAPFSDMSTKIIEMVSNGMSPGNFVVPDETGDLCNIEVATALFRSCEKQRDKLKNYIIYILSHLKLVEALSLKPFAEAVQMIENHYQVKIEELMQ